MHKIRAIPMYLQKNMPIRLSISLLDGDFIVTAKAQNTFFCGKITRFSAFELFFLWFFTSKSA